MNRTVWLAVLFLIVFPLAFAVENYGSGAYGDGAYGKAVCGDNICDASESCSLCSADCGQCSVLSSSSGGGGGGVFTPSNPKAQRFWDSLPAGSRGILSIEDEDIAVSGVEVNVAEDIEKAEITVERYLSRPEAIQAREHAFQYLEIVERNIGDKLDEMTITFTVDSGWLEGNGLDGSTVALEYYDGGRWRVLPTVIKSSNSITGNFLLPVNEGKGILASLKTWIKAGLRAFMGGANKVTGLATGDLSFTYEAEADSFGVFAITAKAIKEEEGETVATCVPAWQCSEWSLCGGSTETRQCEDMNGCGDPSGKPETSRECTEVVSAQERGVFPWPAVLLTFGGILAIGIISILGVRFYHEKSGQKGQARGAEVQVNEAAVRSLGIPDPHLGPAVRYIGEALRKGYHKRDIYQAMVGAGWDARLTERLLQNIWIGEAPEQAPLDRHASARDRDAASRNPYL